MSECYRAVLFDMDGLMLDTERIYYRAQQEAARRLGFEADEQLLLSFVGLSVEECEHRMAEAAGDGFPLTDFMSLWSQLWFEYVDRDGIPLKLGLVPILDWLLAEDVPRAVVTSSSEKVARLCLYRAGIDEYFADIHSGDQVKNNKPAPDIYHLAAKRINLAPSDCIVLEDSDAGVMAAAAAGMRVVQIPDLRLPSDEARNAAYTVASSLVEALPLLQKWITVV